MEKQPLKRPLGIGILTSGGDSPGMNAAVRAIVRSGLRDGHTMYAIYNGYRGLVEGQIEKVDRSWSELTNVLADTIPGIRVVKAFAQEKREVVRFREANDRYLGVNDRINKIWALFAPTVTFLTEIGLLVVWIFGITQVASSAISVGVLAAFLAYIGRFYTRLDSMSRIVTYTQQAAAGAKRIFDILDHV